jgi:hypothetical protein
VLKALLPGTLAAFAFSGCAAPGSAIGHLGFSGTVAGADLRDPLAIEATLPKDYGLGGADRVLGEPEQYGNNSSTLTAPVSAGAFTAEFAPVVYHVTFWLVPPLGAFPKRPPPPTYVVSFSNAPHEVYVLGMNADRFAYRVYDRASRREKAISEAAWRIVDGDFLKIKMVKAQ